MYSLSICLMSIGASYLKGTSYYVFANLRDFPRFLVLNTSLNSILGVLIYFAEVYSNLLFMGSSVFIEKSLSSFSLFSSSIDLISTTPGLSTKGCSVGTFSSGLILTVASTDYLFFWNFHLRYDSLIEWKSFAKALKKFAARTARTKKPMMFPT